MRCRTLAMALREKGKQSVMVGPDLSFVKPDDVEVFEAWVPVSEWLSSKDDAEQVIRIAHQRQATWLVLDDYRVDENYQLTVKSAGFKWLQFDGRALFRLWADIVINANPSAHIQDYAGVLCNPETLLLLGPRYAILRPEFERVITRDPGRPVKKILVTFGGGDDRGANQFVLSTLLPITELDQVFLVVSGISNPNNQRLEQWIATNGQGRVTLYIDPDQVASLFASCDLAVMAGGTTTYEAVRCGLPLLIITIAENQRSQSKAWEAFGCAKYIGDYNEIKVKALIDGFKSIIHKLKYKKKCPFSKVVARIGARKISEMLL